MNFHKRLRKLQAANGLTYKAIGKACGVTYQTVQQWAQDDGTYPKIENLESLAGVLKTTQWFLLFGIHASGEAPIREQLPSLSDEAEELIQCVVQLDKAGGLARKSFAFHTGLLSLLLAEESRKDAQAGLDSEGLTKQSVQALTEAERIAQEVMSREQTSRGGAHGSKRGGG
jgi:transcriptional regulator with XRE-family HTH domain